MPPHADDLDECFQGKDACEGHVDDVERLGVNFRLAVMFDGHRDHVEEY